MYYIYSMTVTDQQQQAYAERHTEISTLLEAITAQENSVYSKLTAGEGDSAAHIASLEELRKQRMATMESLKQIYIDEQSATIGTGRVLADTKMTNELLKHQIGEAESEYDVLRDNKLNKERLVKLGDYEYDRYRSHKNILKVIVYGALAILLILMAMTNIPFFPPAAGVFGILLIMCIVLYTIFGRIYNNFRRRDHNWNKFNYSRYSKNQPRLKTSIEDDGAAEGEDEEKCKSLGWTSPAADVTLTIANDEGFAGMINTETLSRTVEPSNSKEYEIYPTLF